VLRALLVALAVSCSTLSDEPAKIMKASPAADSGFLEEAHRMAENRERHRSTECGSIPPSPRPTTDPSWWLP
jgi:hypothetical protein